MGKELINRYFLIYLQSLHQNRFKEQVWAYLYLKVLLKPMVERYGLKTMKMEMVQHFHLVYPLAIQKEVKL